MTNVLYIFKWPHRWFVKVYLSLSKHNPVSTRVDDYFIFLTEFYSYDNFELDWLDTQDLALKKENFSEIALTHMMFS